MREEKTEITGIIFKTNKPKKIRTYTLKKKPQKTYKSKAWKQFPAKAKLFMICSVFRYAWGKESTVHFMEDR